MNPDGCSDLPYTGSRREERMKQMTWGWLCDAASVFSAWLVLNFEYDWTEGVLVLWNQDRKEVFYFENGMDKNCLLLWSGVPCDVLVAATTRSDDAVGTTAPFIYAPASLPCWYHAQRMSPRSPPPPGRRQKSTAIPASISERTDWQPAPLVPLHRQVLPIRPSGLFQFEIQGAAANMTEKVGEISDKWHTRTFNSKTT
jgi:hypothetical protein